jgi:hypothetical protein
MFLKPDKSCKGGNPDTRQQQADQFEEKRTFGAMNWKTYFVYFKVGGGILGSVFVFFMFIASQAAVVLGDYWLSNWYFFFEQSYKLIIFFIKIKKILKGIGGG